MESLSVVIPVYNEQDNIIPLVSAIIEALGETVEVVVVDDKSTDNTQSVCKNLAQKIPNVTYLRLQKNAGQSAAVYTGVKHAKHTLIATLDGDGQNPPSEIAKLVKAYNDFDGDKSATLFAGHRQGRKDTQVKKLTSKIANKIRKAMLKDNCPDSGCGLKLFNKATFLSLPHFNHMHRFLPALFKSYGLDTINVPITHQPRQHGVSKYNTLGRLKVGIVDLFGVAWLARRACHPKIEEDDQHV
jgi:dolichol-phosphate mannosyltransferase